jgi:CRP-like cAMP-binding protein
MGSHSVHVERARPLLKQNSFLGRLPEVVLEQLIQKGQIRSFVKGSVIYRRGDPGDSLMVVISGRIKLANVSANGKEVVLYFVGPGDIYGEIAALDSKERAADAVALEDSEVFFVYTRDLLPILMAHPPAMFEVIQALCEKVRIGAMIIEDNSLEMRARVARGLHRLAQQHGRRSAGGTSLQLTISQEELGKHLGLSRTNVNRQLGQLKTANVIRIAGMEISIIDEQALAEFAESLPSAD